MTSHLVHVMDENGNEAIYVDGELDRTDSTMYVMDVIQAADGNSVTLCQILVEAEFANSSELEWPESMKELEPFIEPVSMATFREAMARIGDVMTNDQQSVVTDELREVNKRFTWNVYPHDSSGQAMKETDSQDLAAEVDGLISEIDRLRDENAKLREQSPQPPDGPITEELCRELGFVYQKQFSASMFYLDVSDGDEESWTIGVNIARQLVSIDFSFVSGTWTANRLRKLVEAMRGE